MIAQPPPYPSQVQMSSPSLDSSNPPVEVNVLQAWLSALVLKRQTHIPTGDSSDFSTVTTYLSSNRAAASSPWNGLTLGQGRWTYVLDIKPVPILCTHLGQVGQLPCRFQLWFHQASLPIPGATLISLKCFFPPQPQHRERLGLSVRWARPPGVRAVCSRNLHFLVRQTNGTQKKMDIMRTQMRG